MIQVRNLIERELSPKLAIMPLHVKKPEFFSPKVSIEKALEAMKSYTDDKNKIKILISN
jgi:hypothetical protein